MTKLTLSKTLLEAVFECSDNMSAAVMYANTAVPLFAFIRMNANATTSNAAARQKIDEIVNRVNRLAALFPPLLLELAQLAQSEELPPIGAINQAPS